MPKQALSLTPNELNVLRGFLPLGIATTPQLTQVTGLSREVVNAALKRLQATSGEQTQGYVRPAPVTRLYAASKGRPPALYLLAAPGAALLREHDRSRTAKACQLDGPLALSHAICIRDVYFRGRSAGYDVQPEQVIHFGESETIRIDVLLTNLTNQRTFFEIEQGANPSTLERLLDKIRRLSRFFQSTQAQEVSRDIRVLFNVSVEAEASTYRIWEKALAAVAQENGNALPCQFWAMPLAIFAEQPEWTSLERFNNLFNPARLVSFGAPSLSLEPVDSMTSAHTILPPELRPARVADSAPDITLLRAYASVFQDELDAETGTANSFFQLMSWIYGASHNEGAPTRTRAALPIASLFLLRQYLESPRHPDLRLAVIKGVQELRTSYYRGNHIVRDRMTHVIWDVFLKYHGFARGGPLQVHVALPAFDRGRSEFHVRISIQDSDLVIGPDNLLQPGDLDLYEDSLAWVLEALWLYATELGLGRTQAATPAESE